MSYFVLDKSYVQGATKGVLGDFLSDNTMLMTHSFLIEVSGNDAESRARIWKKLVGCWELAPSVRHLMNYELTQNSPCGKPSEHLVKRDYGLIHSLKDSSYEFEEPKKDALGKELESAKYMVELVKQFSMSEFRPLVRSRNEVQIQDIIVNDKEFILEKATILSQVARSFPDGKKLNSIDRSWFHYVWLQSYCLLSLDMTYRYTEDVLASDSVNKKIQHDLRDLEYLMVSVQEGSVLYTKDKKLEKWRGLFV